MQRTLHPKLKSWFDSRCLYPASVSFCDLKNPPQMLLETALSCLSITEEGEDNHGAMIELFQSTIGKPEGQPWCMDFVQSCVAYVESFGFKSDLFPSELCLSVWTNSKCRRPLEPSAGDLVFYQMGDTIKGHVEVVRSVYENAINTIGGNTNDSSAANAISVNIEREGQGVFAKLRPRSPQGKMKCLGFLRVF